MTFHLLMIKFQKLSLNLHKFQTHRPRNKSCLICGQRRFRHGDSIVQHMENGDCWKYFRSRDEARRMIYNFMSEMSATRPYCVEFSLPRGPLPLTFVKLKDEPGVVKQEPGEEDFKSFPKLFNRDLAVPECPYICHDCNRPFYEAHSLLHHRVS